MKILIAGAGKVGTTLARNLSKENNEVTLLDSQLTPIQDAQDSMDIFGVKGSATSMMDLIDAGVRDTDLVIAVTSSDEVNMLCCLTAKRMGVEHTIARIRDPEYSREVNSLKRELGLDMIINPEYQTALEIARLLQFPAAISIDPFANGRIEMVAYRITEQDLIVGKPLYQAMAQIRESVLFCIVERNEEILIPNGQTTLLEGDVAYIIGKSSEIVSFFRSIKRKTSGVRNTVVIGGGKIAYYLCESLMANGVQVKLIEKDEAVCAEMDEMLPGCIVIHGDGTDTHLLEQENVPECESIVLLTGNDEENIISALFAAHLGVKKTIVKSSRDGYSELLKELKLDCVVSPKNITAEQITRYVRALGNSIGSNVEVMYSLADDRAEALQFCVGETTKNIGIPFRSLKFRPGVIVAAIMREGKVIIPAGNDYFQPKDVVIIVGKQKVFNDLNDTFA